MYRNLRIILVVTGIILLFLTMAYYLQWSWVRELWPWFDANSSAVNTSGSLYGGYNATPLNGSSDLSRLSYYFLSSILAAIAIPVIWIGVSGELAAMTGGAVNLAVMSIGLTIYLFQSYESSANQRLLVTALVFLVGTMVAGGLFLWSRRFTFSDQQPLPRPVRVAFGIFIIALLIAGMALILKQPIFPWPLETDVSVVYGWIFLGAVAYFIYGLWVPLWYNACGQLMGFLAYDLILIIPFLNHFATVTPEHRLSLIIYTGVVVLSGLLAIYYLMIYPSTRIWSQHRKPAS